MNMWRWIKRLFVKPKPPSPYAYYDKNILKILDEAGACFRFDEFGKEREIPKGEGKVITFRRYNESNIVRRGQRGGEGDKEGA